MYIHPKKVKTTRTRGAVHAICDKPWDSSIVKGDLAVLTTDFPTLNVWRVLNLKKRELYPEDVFNHPSIADKGMRSGDSYCSLVTIRLYRPSPHFERVGLPFTEKKVDSYLLEKILPHNLDHIISNLQDLKKELEND